MTDFTIFPAIDLRGGKVVRLKRGDPALQTVYEDEPGQVAQRWVKAGASWLHVVNLDGALEELDQANQAGIKSILAITTKLKPKGKVQLGGGIRSLADIEKALNLGVERVILGTLAVQSPDVLTTALEWFGPERIAVAIDTYNGDIKVRGWTHQAGSDPLSFAERLADTGITTLIYTNIAHDGLGIGVDISTAQQLATVTGLAIFASGGVNTLSDVQKVREAGLAGLIIGRALYEGKFLLEEALAC